jgi:hypothetical protein
MVPRRKCALLLTASILVIWFASSILFLHRLSDERNHAVPHQPLAGNANPDAAQTADLNSAANAKNLASSRTTALEKLSLDLKRLASSSQLGSKGVTVSMVAAHLPLSSSSPMQQKDFVAAFKKFEEFVLGPSEDRIPGMRHYMPAVLCSFSCTRSHISLPSSEMNRLLESIENNIDCREWNERIVKHTFVPWTSTYGSRSADILNRSEVSLRLFDRCAVPDLCDAFRTGTVDGCMR